MVGLIPIFSFFNAKMLDHLFDSQAFVGCAPPQYFG
jgi:hypothetical protein